MYPLEDSSRSGKFSVFVALVAKARSFFPRDPLLILRSLAALLLAVVSAICVSTPVWAGPVQDADALMRKGRMPEAEQLLKAHLSANPGDREARLVLGGALAAQGKLDAAYAVYQALVDENPADGVAQGIGAIFAERGATADDARRIDQLFSRVQQAMQARQMDAATQVLDEIVRLAPGNAAARTNLAQILIQLGRQADALPHLEEVFRMRPNDAEAGTQLGAAYERANLNEKARDVYLHIIKVWPRHAPTLFSLGRLSFFQDRDYKTASEWFGKLVQLDPRNVDASYLLGLSRLQELDTSGAEAAFKRAVQADPKYFKAIHQLGLLHESAGREAEALAAFRDVVRYGGNSSEAQQAGRRIELFGGDVETARKVRENTSLAVKAMGAGDLPTARVLLEEILSLVPNNVLARYNLATVYSQEGDNDKAGEQLRAAIAVDPQHYLSHYGLAIIYTGSGQFEQAYESYQNVLRWAPRDDPRRRVADIMVGELRDTIEKFAGMRESRDAFLEALDRAGEGNFQAASERIQKAIQLDPTNPYYHYNAAIFYWELEQAQNSYKELREAVKYKPDHVQSHFRLGLFFLMAGVAQEAVGAFEKVLEFGTDEPEVEEARRRLAEVRGSADGKEKAISYLVIGRSLLKAGNKDAAITAYLRGYQLDPAHRKLTEVLSELLMALGREDEALYYLDQGIRREPKYLPYLSNQGQIYNKREQYDLAEEALKKALAVSATHQRSALLLAKVYEAQKRIDEAVEVISGLLDASPDDVDLVLAKGRLLSRAERYSEAAAVYDWYLAGHDETVAVLIERGLAAEKVAIDEGGDGLATGVEPKYATAAEWFQRAIAIAGPSDAKLAGYARAKLAAAKKWDVRLSQTVLNFNTNANNSTVPRPGVFSDITLSLTYTPFRTSWLSLPLSFSTNHRLHYTFQTYVNTSTLGASAPVNLARLNITPASNVTMVRNQRGTTSVSYLGSLALSGRIGFPKTTGLSYSRTEFVSYLNPRNNYLQQYLDMRLGHDFTLGKSNRFTVGWTGGIDHRTAVSAILDVEKTSDTRTVGYQRTLSKGRVFNMNLGRSKSREDRKTNVRPGDPDRTPVPIVIDAINASSSFSFRPYPRVTAALTGSWSASRFVRGTFQPFPTPEGGTNYVETEQVQGALSVNLRFTFQATDKARWVVELVQVENRVTIDIPSDLEAELTGNIQQDNINKQQKVVVSMNYAF